MRNRLLYGIRLSIREWAAGVLLAIALLCPAAYAFTNVATGLNGGMGIAADPAGTAIYFVESGAGTLKKAALSPPTCVAPACTVSTLLSTFTHPQDVALDLDHNVAYVTTLDDIGTTGKLWRVDLNAPFAPSLVTFNLEWPKQIALDAATDTAYVTGSKSGILWKIQLATGLKKKIITGLQKPVGVILSADRTRAYVSEETAGQVNEIDVALGKSLRTFPLGAGSTPAYLAWADPTQSSLYAVKSATNELARVDLPSSSTIIALTGLPATSQSVALSPFGGAIFIGANPVIVRENLGTLPPTAPVFLGVGNVPYSAIDINSGYATTAAGYFLQVKDAPFGGTLNIFGNFTTFAAIGTHYRVMVSYNGGTPAPLIQSWTMYRWANTKYVSVTIVPDAQGRYAIPAEYLGPTPASWALLPAFLMMRMPTTLNGKYELSVEVYKFNGTTFTDQTALLTTGNKLTLRVDNDPPIISFNNIYQFGSPTPIGTCAIVDTPVFVPPAKSMFQLDITAYDPNGHLLSYSAVAYWGNNLSGTVIPTVSYPAQNGFGVTNAKLPAGGWGAGCNCAHTFFVRASKRTIDGYGYILHGSASRSITIKNTGQNCPN